MNLMNNYHSRLCFLLLAVVFALATTGCERKAVGIALNVPATPITQPFPATIRRGETVQCECVTYGVGGRFTIRYKGKVRVQMKGGPGITVAPDHWEMTMTATNDSPHASRQVSVIVDASAPPGTNFVKVIVTRKDGGQNDELVEFLVQ